MADQDFAFGQPMPPSERAVEPTGELRRLYDAITEDCTVDDVAANAGLSPARASSGLAEMELEGLVVVSNGRWRRS